MVINQVCVYSICHHTNCGGDLLVSAMTKFTASFPPLLEELVKHIHLLTNMTEALDAHPKPSQKVAFGKRWILGKVDPHQLVVSFYPLTPILISTEHGATVLLPLPLVKIQNNGHIFFLL
jgi:hypothetical protein